MSHLANAAIPTATTSNAAETKFNVGEQGVLFYLTGRKTNEAVFCPDALNDALSRNELTADVKFEAARGASAFSHAIAAVVAKSKDLVSSGFKLIMVPLGGETREKGARGHISYSILSAYRQPSSSELKAITSGKYNGEAKQLFIASWVDGTVTFKPRAEDDDHAIMSDEAQQIALRIDDEYQKRLKYIDAGFIQRELQNKVLKAFYAINIRVNSTFYYVPREMALKLAPLMVDLQLILNRSDGPSLRLTSFPVTDQQADSVTEDLQEAIVKEMQEINQILNDRQSSDKGTSNTRLINSATRRMEDLNARIQAYQNDLIMEKDILDLYIENIQNKINSL